MRHGRNYRVPGANGGTGRKPTKRRVGETRNRGYRSSAPRIGTSDRYRTIGVPSSGSAARIARLADRTAHVRDDRGRRLGHSRSKTC